MERLWGRGWMKRMKGTEKKGTEKKGTERKGTGRKK